MRPGLGLAAAPAMAAATELSLLGSGCLACSPRRGGGGMVRGKACPAVVLGGWSTRLEGRGGCAVAAGEVCVRVSSAASGPVAVQAAATKAQGGGGAAAHSHHRPGQFPEQPYVYGQRGNPGGLVAVVRWWPVVALGQLQPTAG